MPKIKTKYQRLLDKTDTEQQEASVGANVPVSTINRFARGLTATKVGGNITLRTLKRLCQFHQCTPNDLLDYEKWGIKLKTK